MRTICIDRRAILLGVLSFLLFPERAHAIPPPDFVVNAGMQIAQVVGVALFFCSTGLAFLMRKFQASISSPYMRGLIVLLVLGGFGLSWFFYQHN